jgi:hypothetical protein
MSHCACRNTRLVAWTLLSVQPPFQDFAEEPLVSSFTTAISRLIDELAHEHDKWIGFRILNITDGFTSAHTVDGIHYR